MEKLTDEQKKMVEDNLAFATYVAKKYLKKNDYITNQDIIQEARIAMIKAIPRFNPDIAKFSTYMYPTIDGHLKRFVGYKNKIVPIPHQKHLKEETKQKAENIKNIISLDKKIYNNSSFEEFTLMDIIPDEENMEDSIINKLSIIHAIKELNWREKIVIIYRFYFDLNQTVIGNMMGISQVHVHRIEKKALNKMKEFLK